MTEKEDQIGPDEAREALETIEETEKAGLRRAIPPRWFGVAIALTVGALIAAAAAGLSTYVGLLVIALAGIMEFQRRKAGASLKAFPSNAAGILAFIGLLAFSLLLLIGLKVLTERFDIAWAPLAGGAFLATVIYILSVLNRRQLLARIDAEKGE